MQYVYNNIYIHNRKGANMENKSAKHREYTDAHRKATQKYMDARGRIALTTTKEEKQRIEAAAKSAGKSVNRFILDIVLKDLQ